MLLQLDNLCASFGAIEVLHGISLEVADGEIVTLIGANGAGKTTTLRCASGLHRPSGGTLRFAGQDIGALPAQDIVRLGLVHCPEGRRVFARMTVGENLDMGAYTRRDPDGVRADFARVFELFPVLAERRKQAAGTLSGGEQQMLAVGRAMMARPRLLLLDEPSLGLAPIVVARIFEVIQGLNAQGTTVLLVEQNARMALAIAHRGYVLETGRVAIEGKAPDLLEDARVKAAYLGE